MKLFSLIILILFVSVNFSYAQCCAAGNPASGGIGSSVGKNKLMIGINHKYSYSDTYFKGAEKIDYTYLQASDFHFSSLNLKYGITKSLTTSLEIGYFESKSKTFNDIKSIAYGLGDAILGLSYGLKINEGLSFQPSLNITLPIGVFDFIDNGVFFPIDFQPSAGSYRFGGSISGAYIFANARWRTTFYANMTYSAPVQSDLVSYYKYGNLYMGGVACSYRVWRKLNVNLGTRFQYRDKAISRNDFVMNSTGGQLAFLIPKISYGFGEGWNINLSADLPVYKNMNGRQLTNAYMISGGISKLVNFNANDSIKTIENLQAQHLVTTIKISGTCMSCKAVIEEITNKQRGVITSSWEVESHELTIHHKKKFNLDKLLKSLAKENHIKESEPETKNAF